MGRDYIRIPSKLSTIITNIHSGTAPRDRNASSIESLQFSPLPACTPAPSTAERAASLLHEFVVQGDAEKPKLFESDLEALSDALGPVGSPDFSEEVTALLNRYKNTHHLYEKPTSAVMSVDTQTSSDLLQIVMALKEALRINKIKDTQLRALRAELLAAEAVAYNRTESPPKQSLKRKTKKSSKLGKAASASKTKKSKSDSFARTQTQKEHKGVFASAPVCDVEPENGNPSRLVSKKTAAVQGCTESSFLVGKPAEREDRTHDRRSTTKEPLSDSSGVSAASSALTRSLQSYVESATRQTFRSSRTLFTNPLVSRPSIKEWDRAPTSDPPPRACSSRFQSEQSPNATPHHPAKVVQKIEIPPLAALPIASPSSPPSLASPPLPITEKERSRDTSELQRNPCYSEYKLTEGNNYPLRTPLQHMSGHRKRFEFPEAQNESLKCDADDMSSLESESTISLSAVLEAAENEERRRTLELLRNLRETEEPLHS